MRTLTASSIPVHIRHAILATPPHPHYLRRPQRGLCRHRPAVMDAAVIKETKDTEVKAAAKPAAESPPPPPPEKPLPGDCCGSGCVRCVWDVYYEELEEYQKKISDGS